MLLAAYVLDMFTAAFLMAVGCWLPALILVIIGLGMALWCFKHRERRSPDSDQGVPVGLAERRVHTRR